MLQRNMHGPVPLTSLRAGWTPFGKGQSPGEIKRREVSWTLKLAQKKSRAGQKVGLHFASVVTQQQCYGHCPCDCSAKQLKQQLHGTPVYLLCNGKVTLLWLFWQWSMASSVFQVGACGRAFTLSPHVPIPNHHITYQIKVQRLFSCFPASLCFGL